MKKNPPKCLKWIVQRFLTAYSKSPALGDLDEEFDIFVEEVGLKRARHWYRQQVLKSLPYCWKHTIYWRFGMLVNYLKIAFRTLMRQKMYSLITISGLAVGLGIFLLFYAFYDWKMTADSFHTDIDRIYNIVQVRNAGSGEQHTAYVPYPLAPSLEDDIPEIEDFTRFYDSGRSIVSYKEKKFYESKVLFVDPNFMSFFTFNLTQGNRESLLSNPNSVVISERIAQKYFGDEPAIGKVLTLENKLDVIITGIFEDLDKQQSISSLYGRFLIPLEAAQNLYGLSDNWDDNYFTGFVRLQKGFDLQQIEEKLELSRTKY